MNLPYLGCESLCIVIAIVGLHRHNLRDIGSENLCIVTTY